jgi:signal transduction histidine kinase/tetratricopeptide (TPR) repeat protein
MAQESQAARIVVGRYRVARPLGSGAHGKVYLAEDLSRGGERVALKIVEGLIGGGDDEPAQRILQWFRHPNWAEVLDAGRCGEYDWFQASRYITGQSLDRLKGPQDPSLVWRFLEDGARVLRSLHERGLLHYDVTPGNWILEEGGEGARFVLTDGGLAHVGPIHGVARGTPLFMAPEVTEDRAHDHRADLYSLGLVAFRLATGTDPFQGGAGEIMGRRRREDCPRASTIRPSIPGALDALLADLLARDPNGRPHDGAALLERLGEARGMPVSALLPSEAVAAAGGGEIVGREAQVVRFRAALSVLAQHLPEKPGKGAKTGPAPSHEPVFLLHGPPGIGATRLARELLAAARSEELPVLLIAGREGAPDRRGPLRRLVDGLASLGRDVGEVVEDVRLDLRNGADEGREERAHAEERVIERFIAALDATARRTPFVLVVEDFPDLPPLAQEAFRVLSRYLLARTEHAAGVPPPPVALVIDLGAADPTPFLIPDSADPRTPVLEIPPLGAGQVASLCRSRFSGLSPDERDLQSILKVSEGLPAVVVALLAEGARRGELRHEAGRWSWNVDKLSVYVVDRALPPAHAEALAVADESLLGLLQCLALLDADLREDAVQSLWKRLSSGPMPPTPLLATRRRGEQTFYAVSTQAIRRALRSRMDGALVGTRSRELLDVLRRHLAPETILDRAHLMVGLGEGAGALALLASEASQLTGDMRLAMQPVLHQILDGTPALLQDPTKRRQLADLLERGPDAVAVARRLAHAFPVSAAELPAVLRVVTVLEDSEQHEELASLVAAHAQARRADAISLAYLEAARARVAFRLRQPEQAVAALDRVRLTLREHRATRRAHPRLLVQYLSARAQQCHLEGNDRASIRALLAAKSAARTARAPTLRAAVLNNLGIAYQNTAKEQEARQSMERSLRLLRLIGDVRGVALTTYNLARILQKQGRLLASASLLQDAANIALRHGLVHRFTEALRELAKVLDRQQNAPLAAVHLLRALRAASTSAQPLNAARVAYDLGPLSAACGDVSLAALSLHASARAARQRTARESRAMHSLTAALVALHFGSKERALVCLGRANRRSADLFGDSRDTLALILAALPSPPAFATSPSTSVAANARPARGATLRPLYRAMTWARRTLAQPERVRPLPLALPHLRAPGVRAPDGRERRIVEEVGILVAQRLSIGRRRDVLQRIQRIVAHTGERQLQARVLALLSDSQAGPTGDEAMLFSRAVALVADTQQAPLRVLRPVSQEHSQVATTYTRRLAILDMSPPWTVATLHGLAHRVLLRAGCASAPDQRLSSALRRVLEATARMKAGGGLEELLQAMTRHTTEITGAQRACVVLLETGSDTHIRVATSASSGGGHVDVRDLSHTVIRRVLTSRTPLLLHDVFGDAELMGRPSVTSMSLRSILCVPMLRGDELFGVMYADNASAAGSFDQVDLEVLSLFAEQAAAAIETHRLVADLQRSYADLKAVQERLVRGERLRVIGELSSGVAHEFNNLLTAILARVQLMSLNYLDPEMKRDLGLVEKAAMDAAGVVRRLQTFSRQQRQGNFTIVNVAEVCADAVEFLRPLWGTRRRHGRPPIAVRLRTEPHLYVRGDPTELREVVTNLLKNALDALDDGGEIRVSATRRDGRIRLRVEDDGQGIAPEHLPRIFDPFYSTKGERGTGLGLCLCQQIAERHGGEIHAESTLGEGTVVSVNLPETAAPNVATASQPAVGEHPPRHFKILVVDDDQDVLRPLCTFLEKSGYEVVPARDAAEALTAVPSHHPDIVISDIGMPGMDGIELCRKLRASSPRLPIVLMSGWASEVDPARAREAGAGALLAKPFAMQQVTDLLAALTSRK